MKKFATKFTAVLLCVLMAVSVFAVPMGAQTLDVTETEKIDGSVLWSADFDDFASSGKTVSAYTAEAFTSSLSGFSSNNTITDGKLNIVTNVWQLNGAKDNKFRDLYYGLYKDAKGNAVTEYYMDIDYSIKTSTYARAYSLGNVTVGSDTVTYTVYSPYRGDSFFNPMHGGNGYNKWLFKVSPNGTLYTADMFRSTVRFSTADGANTNLEYFVYTKKVNGVSTEIYQPMTQEVWETLRSLYGKEKASSASSGDADCFDKVAILGKGYQLELGKEYTIRVLFSVSSSGEVTASTYVRPVGSNGAFTYVGKTSYTFDTTKLTTNNTIRVSENSTTYTFDNMKFATFGECLGEHQMPVVQTEASNDTVGDYKLMECLACGAEYYVYEKIETLMHGDFDGFTEAEYNSFKTSHITAASSGYTFAEGEGIEYNTTNSKIWITSPITDKSPFRLTIKANFKQFPKDWSDGKSTKDGGSFLTLMTGSTSGYYIYLRMGRNADGGTEKNQEAVDSTGWVKFNDKNQIDAWNKIEKVEGVTLALNTDYTFTFDFDPAKSSVKLSVNGTYVGEGYLSNFPTASSTAGYPAFRIGDGLDLNMTLKECKIEKIVDECVYDLLEHTYGYNFNYDINTYKPDFFRDEKYGVLLGSDAAADKDDLTVEKAYEGAPVWIRDTNLVLLDTPYTVSFDYMVGEGGKFVATNSTDTYYLSLVSLITEGTAIKYGSMVRVGAQDTDSDGSLDKYFLVMNKGYSEADDSSAVYYLTPGEWIRVSVAVHPRDKSVYLYVNDELVGMAIRDAYQLGSGITKSSIRIGDSYRRFVFPWAVKDVEVDVTPKSLLETTASGEIFHMDFGKSLAVNPGIAANNNPILGGTATNWSMSYEGVTGFTTYRDSGDTEGYSHVTVNPAAVQGGATNLFNLSTSATLSDGSFINLLEGKKYSIEISYALNKDKTSLSEKEIEAIEHYNANNEANATDYSTSFNFYNSLTPVVIRLSKYTDGNACRLFDNTKNGLRIHTASGTLNAYYKNGTRPNGYSSFDENGKPKNGFLNVKAVVDEATNTYTAYANGELLYYKDANDNLIPAVNVAMKVTASSASLVYGDSTWDGFYSSIPRAKADGTTHSGGLKNTSYIRFLQSAYDFSVQDIKVEKLDKGVELVGSQVKKHNDSESFDVRFVFGVDDIYVHNIEYDIKASSTDGDVGEIKTVDSKSTVYRSIVADGKAVNAYKYDQGKYFSVFAVEDVPLSDENVTYIFEVTPYITAYNPLSGKIERVLLGGAAKYTVKYDGNGGYVGGMVTENGSQSASFNYQDISTLPYKALGRTQMLNGALTADWSAAGIEFTATCVGDVYLNLTSTSLFTVTVDAENDAYDSVRKDVKLGSGRAIIASGLPYGTYTFKIENQSGYSQTVDIKGAAVFGTFGEAPRSSELLIEFIGDSITHGCGLGRADYSDGTNDGTLTYAYLAAKELGADYTIMANGGMGVLWGGDYDGLNINRSMEKYPFLNDTKRAGEDYTGYGEDVDLVVIGLSTNDNYRMYLMYNNELKAFKGANPTATEDEISAHMNEFKASKLELLTKELKALIAEIEENHGKTVPIVLARGMMERAANDPIAELYHTSVTHMTDIIENVWQGVYGEHVIKVAHLTPDRTGYEGHPTREGAAVQGADLAAFIKAEFPDLVPAK